MRDLLKQQAREVLEAWEEAKSRADGADDEPDIAEQAMEVLRELVERPEQ